MTAPPVDTPALLESPLPAAPPEEVPAVVGLPPMAGLPPLTAAPPMAGLPALAGAPAMPVFPPLPAWVSEDDEQLQSAQPTTARANEPPDKRRCNDSMILFSRRSMDR